MAYPVQVTPLNASPTGTLSVPLASVATKNQKIAGGNPGWYEVDYTGAPTTTPLGLWGPFVIQIDSEKILCSPSVTGEFRVYQDATLNGRGYSSTTVAAHSAGANITLVSTSAEPIGPGGTQVVSSLAVASNAVTVPISSASVVNVTNNAAGSAAITLTTSGASDGQTLWVRFYDFSAASQTISWVNTENSTATAPTSSNGSTTLPKTVQFMYNGATSKWRCILSV